MAVRMQVDDGVPFFIKEYFLPVKLRIINLLCKGIHDPFQSFLYLGKLCYPVKLCVSFKNMKQSVHCFLSDHTVFGKLVIFDLMKALIKGFLVSKLIRTFGLNDMEQLFCHIKSLLITACLIIGGKSIDGKGLIVGMLGGVTGDAVVFN